MIAIVGASPKPERPSHYVGQYLKDLGYRVIGVNPGQAGRILFGEPAVARLSDIDAPIDMVDIFRRSDQVPQVVEEALAAFPGLKTIWMQLGIMNAEAATFAEARGVTVVQDRCPEN